MIDYNIANLKNQLEPNKNKVILFGAGDIGELSNYSLNKMVIVVDFFCDNDPKKHGSKYLGVEVISMDALKKLDKDANVFISNNYVSTISKELKKEGACFGVGAGYESPLWYAKNEELLKFRFINWKDKKEVITIRNNWDE